MSQIISVQSALIIASCVRSASAQATVSRQYHHSAIYRLAFCHMSPNLHISQPQKKVPELLALRKAVAPNSSQIYAVEAAWLALWFATHMVWCRLRAQSLMGVAELCQKKPELLNPIMINVFDALKSSRLRTIWYRRMEFVIFGEFSAKSVSISWTACMHWNNFQQNDIVDHITPKRITSYYWSNEVDVKMNYFHVDCSLAVKWLLSISVDNAHQWNVDAELLWSVSMRNALFSLIGEMLGKSNTLLQSQQNQCGQSDIVNRRHLSTLTVAKSPRNPLH